MVNLKLQLAEARAVLQAAHCCELLLLVTMSRVAGRLLLLVSYYCIRRTARLLLRTSIPYCSIATHAAAT